MRAKLLAGNSIDQTKRPKIILLHGIDGRIDKTWQRNNCHGGWWIDMSAQFGCLVYGIEYKSAKLTFGSEEPKTQIETYSEALVNLIIDNDLLSNMTIFITHSYGGLLLKRALCDSFLMDKHRYFENRWNNIRAVRFLGTPHHGSNIASWLWPLARLFRIATYGLGDLRWKSRIVNLLNHDFEKYKTLFQNLLIINVRETRGVLLIQYVHPIVARYLAFLPKLPRRISNLDRRGGRRIDLLPKGQAGATATKPTPIPISPIICGSVP